MRARADISGVDQSFMSNALEPLEASKLARGTEIKTRDSKSLEWATNQRLRECPNGLADIGNGAVRIDYCCLLACLASLSSNAI